MKILKKQQITTHTKHQTFGVMLVIIIVTILLGMGNVYAEGENVAKIGENNYSSIYEAVQDAEEGDIVEILGDIEETRIINIVKGITINGNGHKLVSNISKGNATFLINTSNGTIINDLIIETSARGVAINNSVSNFTINNSTIDAGERGITVNSNANTDSTLNVNNCMIKKHGIDNYDEVVINDYSRGISLWEYTNSTISIKNTTIQGFAYDVNITAANIYDSSTVKLTLDQCILKGRAGINSGNVTGINITIRDSEILGINNEAGLTESFGNIVIYDTGNANLNIINTKLSNYQNEIGANNQNAVQYLLDIRSEGNIIRLSGNTFGIDTMKAKKDIGTIIKLAKEQNNVEITGGTYDYDVKEYVPNDYVVINENNKYVVGKKAQKLEVLENLELTIGDKYNLKATINPEDTIETIKYSSNNTEVLEIDQEGKITTKKAGTAIITVTVGDINKTCKVIIKDTNIELDIPEINTDSEEINIGILPENKLAINEIIMNSIKNNISIEKIIDEHKKDGEQIVIEVQLDKLKDEEISSDEKNKFEELLINGKILQYFDILIELKANDVKVGEITELANPIRFTVTLPESLQNIEEGYTRTYYIVREHEGNTQILNATISEDGKYLTFETEKFSTFAIAYSDKKVEEDQKQEEAPVNVDTGSNITTNVIIFIISIIGIYALVVNKKTYNSGKH